MTILEAAQYLASDNRDFSVIARCGNCFTTRPYDYAIWVRDGKCPDCGAVKEEAVWTSVDWMTLLDAANAEGTLSSLGLSTNNDRVVELSTMMRINGYRFVGRCITCKKVAFSATPFHCGTASMYPYTTLKWIEKLPIAMKFAENVIVEE